ncbi:MAG: glycosyltransferase [Acidobacteriota bacterium]|nr:glycosyltransferase [Acidobacteriota bacterium]
MHSSYTKTAVIIPTRNRADLAINAARSVLGYGGDALRLLVSDNSTNEADLTTLAEFCRQLSDPRVTYFRPPQPFAMTEHWEWAMQQALNLADASHFIFLTDRSMFKPDEVGRIIELSRQNPDKVVSYDWVTIFDHWNPIFVEERTHTGQVIPVTAERLLYLSSRSLIPNSLPRMMNNSAPRIVLEAIGKRFGSVFASISPDYNFCFRCLEVVDDILYYDAAAYVSYAIPRSNGVSAVGMSTLATQDFDFQLNLGGARRSFATPEPAFETPANYVLHEYCLVKAETESEKFPEVARDEYFARNASEAAANHNPQLRKEMKALLKTHGYSLAVKHRLRELRSSLSLRTRARKLLSLEWPAIATRVGPFTSVEEAINYAISVPLSEDATSYHLRLLRD